MLLKNQRDSRRRIEIVSNIARPDVDNAKPHMSPRSDFGDVLMRMLYVPAGMTEEDARKISGFSLSSEQDHLTENSPGKPSDF
jgi:hypothetical protein